MRGWAARPGPHRWGGEVRRQRWRKREREPERGGVRETESEDKTGQAGHGSTDDERSR